MSLLILDYESRFCLDNAHAQFHFSLLQSLLKGRLCILQWRISGMEGTEASCQKLQWFVLNMVLHQQSSWRTRASSSILAAVWSKNQWEPGFLTHGDNKIITAQYLNTFSFRVIFNRKRDVYYKATSRLFHLSLFIFLEFYLWHLHS